MNGAISKISRRPNILISSFSAIAAASRPSSKSPYPMTIKHRPFGSLLHGLLLNDKIKVGSAVRRCPYLSLAPEAEDVIARNAGLLRARGLGDPVKLADFIYRAPVALIRSPHDLDLAFSTVQRELGLAMGDDGGDEDCINAVALAATLNEKGFVSMIKLVRSLGFKDEDMLLLFKRAPIFLATQWNSHLACKMEYFREMAGFGPGEMLHSIIIMEKIMEKTGGIQVNLTEVIEKVREGGYEQPVPDEQR